MNKSLSSPCLMRIPYLTTGVLWMLLLGCLGCGTREYESRLNTSITNLRRSSVFIDMHPSADLTGTPVTVKVPNLFNLPPMVKGEPVDGQEVDQRRLEPPVVTVTGLMLTYEGLLADSAGGKQSYYLYLGVVDTSLLMGKDLPTLMFRQAQTAFSGTTPLETVTCDTPDGRSTDWKKLRVSGKQPFYYVAGDGKTDFREMDGVMEFFIRQEGNFIVTIGWRAPASPEGVDYPGLAIWGPRIAGTVALKQ